LSKISTASAYSWLSQAHENGNIEQRHYRFKQAVDQTLMMRGGRDFATVAAYV
jgi:hypothetical protein